MKHGLSSETLFQIREIPDFGVAEIGPPDPEIGRIETIGRIWTILGTHGIPASMMRSTNKRMPITAYSTACSHHPQQQYQEHEYNE